MQRVRGFTLVELVVVLMLTAMLAVAAVPRLFQRSSYDARAAHDQLLLTVRYARQLAIGMRRNVCVGAANTQVEVTYAASSGVAQPCGAGLRAANPANGVPFGDAANALPGSAPLAAAGALVFDAEGRPHAADGTPLAAAAAFSVVGYAVPVTVEPETGVVR